MRHIKIIAIATAFTFVACNTQGDKSASTDEKTQNSSEDIVAFESNGYLKSDRVDLIKAEQARIKTISAYEYALPIVGLEQWHQGFTQQAEYGDWLIYQNRATKVPIITANTTTPYVMSFANLAESSYYFEIPAGPIGGLIESIYQSPQSDLGVVGPDKGKAENIYS